MLPGCFIRCKQSALSRATCTILHGLLVGAPITHSTVEVIRAGPINALSVFILHREVIQNTPPVVDTAVEVDVQLVDDVRGNGVAWLCLAVGLLSLWQG